MGQSAKIQELLNQMVPVKDRPWYPWTWPDAEQWKGMPQAEREAFIKRAREYCLSDLFFFSEHVLRNPKHMNLHLGLHDEICYLLQCEIDLGILVPRNTLKSTLASEAYPLWRICRNTSDTILLASDTIGVAMNFLRYIKDNITTNERFMKIFPNIIPTWANERKTRYKNWNRFEIEVMRDEIVPWPTIKIMGMDGQTLTGFHSRVGLYDDVVTNDNANSREKMAKVKDNFDMSLNLLDMNAIKKIVGTRYCDGDLYGDMLDKNRIPFYIREAVENGQYCWPVQPYIDRVNQKRDELSPKMFASQYLNQIIASGEEEFPQAWIKRWDVNSVREEMGAEAPASDDELMTKWLNSLERYMGCDPARSDKKNSDYTTIIVAGMDSRERLFVLDQVRKRMKTDEIVKTFIAKFIEWNPKNAKIETYGGDIHVFNDVKRTMKDEGQDYFRVGEYPKTAHMSGNDRIRILQRPMNRGQIFLAKRIDFVELDYEILHFPYAKHDDLLTVLAYIWEHQAKRKAAKPVEKATDGWGSRRMHRSAQGSWMTV